MRYIAWIIRSNIPESWNSLKCLLSTNPWLLKSCSSRPFKWSFCLPVNLSKISGEESIALATIAPRSLIRYWAFARPSACTTPPLMIGEVINADCSSTGAAPPNPYKRLCLRLTCSHHQGHKLEVLRHPQIDSILWHISQRDWVGA